MIKKHLFVFIQFGGILVILLSGPAFASKPLLLLLEIAGILTGTCAVLTMKIDNLNVYPDLKENARFVSNGLYKIIRHPMYLSILVTLLPLIIELFSIFRLVIYLLILVDLVLKINYEEKILEKNFPKYKEYKTKSWKLLPFVY